MLTKITWRRERGGWFITYLISYRALLKGEGEEFALLKGDEGEGRRRGEGRMKKLGEILVFTS